MVLMVGYEFRIRKLTGECLNPANVVECNGLGGKSEMVWGAISNSGWTELIMIDGNLTVVHYCNKDYCFYHCALY